jgi:hypothetical protein
MWEMRALEGLAVFLFIVGGVLWVKAWKSPNSNSAETSHAQMLGGLATGVFTGGAFAVVLLFLQPVIAASIAASQADAVWRASVSAAADIPGFTSAGHKLRGLDLSGKQLQDANLKGAWLTGVELRDTNLSNANLVGAHLHGVVMYSATLTEANLAGADLSGAQIQGVHFEHTDITGVKFAGAKANAATCWPKRFLESRQAKGIQAGDLSGYPGTSRGQEPPNCLKGP